MRVLTQPDVSGVYRFVGKRFDTLGRAFVWMDEVVLYEEKRGDMNWVISFFGRARLYPLSRFEGEWFWVETGKSYV